MVFLNNSKQFWAISGLLFGAVCWGIIWYPYRIMQEAGISGVASSFYTYVIAVILGLLMYAKRWRSAANVPKSIFWLALVAGWTNLSYVLAVIDGEVMRVMLLFYLSPLWTLLLAHFWLKERVSGKRLAVIAISLTGAFIMLWQPDALPLPQNQAEWLAMSAGIGFAMTNVITRKSIHLSVASKSMAVWFGVLMMTLIFIPFQTLPLPSPEVFSATHWIIMVVIALLVMAATLVVQYGITHVPVTRASVLFMFELVVAAIASYYLANEAMELHEWIGGSLIVAAALFAARMEAGE
ncbi:MAG TPA: DMT family transporter [Methylophilaceae bacterium]|nr:DMT family transporter [Methylophilaceae bacterium]